MCMSHIYINIRGWGPPRGWFREGSHSASRRDGRPSRANVPARHSDDTSREICPVRIGQRSQPHHVGLRCARPGRMRQVRTQQSWLTMDWPFAQHLKGGLVPQGDRHHQHGYRVDRPRERQPPYRPIQSRCTHLQQSRAGARKACKVPCKSMMCVEIFVLSVWPASLPPPAIGSRRLSWRRARLASIGRRQWLWWCAEPKVRDRRDRII